MRITVETFCPVCGKLNHVVVEESDFVAWQHGTLVQDAFPYLSADERELFVSGICSDCWNKMFATEKWWTEEDEENEEEEDEYWLELEEDEEEEEEEDCCITFDTLSELLKLLGKEED